MQHGSIGVPQFSRVESGKPGIDAGCIAKLFDLIIVVECAVFIRKQIAAILPVWLQNGDESFIVLRFCA